MPKRIGFYTAGPSFEGDSLESGPLGGSETAFIQITRALSRRGHQITVFNNCSAPGEYQGIQYYPFRESIIQLAENYFDVFVVSRFFGFFTLPIKTGLKVLWNHDTLDQPKDLKALHDEIDLFLVLSTFHQDNFLTKLPQIEDRLALTRNGLDFQLMDQAAAGVVQDPNLLLYASRPERGLQVLLEAIWPRIHQKYPHLRLGLCGYQLSKHNLAPDLLALYDYLDLLVAKTEGVENLGALSKNDYYRTLAQARLLIYPCVFPEVSCLVALEAQALGTPILTSNSFALQESVVEAPMKISGRPASPQYNQDFIERAFNFLENPVQLAEVAQTAKEKIRARYSWDQIAAEWDRMFDLNLAAKGLKDLTPQVKNAWNSLGAAAGASICQ